ncbi:MAG: cob(I)yrinic acid a,c-diamide adenosyltransferase [Thaumarchaeota archaeon]|nr:MAG: cob(I)yrinic acid a,c-diamide adenosyltransferase [Nitrososphaerota archaeon]TLX88062.1 MAG: cob(I)yrinic acid a,c-diamide adenosyltransferase [Nitrososphaerota archaeon]TLX90964.1 MAG: cob(I)yrinic acid a,c-diamide adenosyltransferase [Nitrososphaerota archaeon]
MKIYTKTGDKGDTGLIDGSRISKSDLRIIAYGEVDEANSQIGLTISHIDKTSIFYDVKEILLKIQQDLFVLGADLANPNCLKDDSVLVRKGMISNIEHQIDNFESELEPISYFILPGGTTESSLLHVCRTVVRRAETSAVALAKEQKINQEILIYLNRLSDLFFVLARVINKRQKCNDVPWRSS